jgi:cysteinyl-tRNA synthetase
MHHPLHLTNTLTGRTERFVPRQETGGPETVRMFTCGPSVYRPQHLGNYRTYLFEDVLQRHLAALGYRVERVINFTDVEDKAIAEAREQGTSLEALRRPVEEAFFRECGLLGIRLPGSIPRATASVESAVDIVQRLLDRGHAYWHEGDVFFDPLTYEGFGRIFGLDMSQWPTEKRRFRKDTYPGQQWNLGDFILWHGWREGDGDVYWETALGKGRPAWNVQDAGMIAKHLGFEIDIHTGGIDNLYRHHDYTLAVMEGASGKTFCPWWLHGEHLLVNGEKMSKSKGNVAFLDDLLGGDYDPGHVRWYLLGRHYRDKLDLTPGSLSEAAERLDEVRGLVVRVCGPLGEGAAPGDAPRSGVGEALRGAVVERLNRDLDVAGAFQALAEELRRLDAERRDQGGMDPAVAAEAREAVEAVDGVLGFLGRTA